MVHLAVDLFFRILITFFFLTASTSHFVTLLYDLDDESILLPEDVSFVSSIELGTGNHGRESPAIPKRASIR